METSAERLAIALVVNGRPRALAPGATVAELVAELGGDARPVAVERNGEIVPRGRWSATPLAGGDRIEIVRFVQGG
jgi:thiamine biosynthesis protein ThiS